MHRLLLLAAVLAAAGCGGHAAAGSSSTGCSAGTRAERVAAVRAAEHGMMSVAGAYVVAGAGGSGNAPQLRVKVDSAIRREITAVRQAEPCIGAKAARSQLAADAQLWKAYPAFAALFRGALAGV